MLDAKQICSCGPVLELLKAKGTRIGEGSNDDVKPLLVKCLGRILWFETCCHLLPLVNYVSSIAEIGGIERLLTIH
nr:MAG TPA: hypothetical protein [Caudoviricetes sp.]